MLFRRRFSTASLLGITILLAVEDGNLEPCRERPDADGDRNTDVDGAGHYRGHTQAECTQGGHDEDKEQLHVVTHCLIPCVGGLNSVYIMSYIIYLSSIGEIELDVG